MFHNLLFLLLLAVGPSQAGEAPLKESPNSTIGFGSVQEALTALRADPDMVESVQGGWTIFVNKSDHALWSFTPADHPAHPSAVRRKLVEKDGGIYVDMKVLCQAKKAPCDQLVRDFNQLNEQMRQSVVSGQTGHTP